MQNMKNYPVQISKGCSLLLQSGEKWTNIAPYACAFLSDAKDRLPYLDWYRDTKTEGWEWGIFPDRVITFQRKGT